MHTPLSGESTVGELSHARGRSGGGAGGVTVFEVVFDKAGLAESSLAWVGCTSTDTVALASTC